MRKNPNENWLLIATGSNLGESLTYLRKARDILSTHFTFVAESRIYHSKAVGYENQPDFYNQVLQFELPALSPDEVMTLLLKIEKDLGRTREIHQGPRTIDLDILFWGKEEYQTELVNIPHPRWHERSFVVQPLKELPCFINFQKYFKIPHTFTNEASPI